jgi:hypothetical protein
LPSAACLASRSAFSLPEISIWPAVHMILRLYFVLPFLLRYGGVCYS